MRYASNVDRNHARIGQALRKVTWVKDMRMHGGVGYDFLARHVGYGGPVFIEVKDPSKPPSARKLTDSEEEMLSVFGGFYFVVLTEEDALRAVGITVPLQFPARPTLPASRRPERQRESSPGRARGPRSG